ncbi:hypothetical protein M569_03360 [Genlisea aurea]|uniref:Chaperone DnaJ C-terminal domain-containing protein n=1 Tax=Genlisea aurea TaxID=192259 RepID=S8D217_9LAMI|nr:hypothetical protein M569_03360 [Genlisea aurea]
MASHKGKRRSSRKKGISVCIIYMYVGTVDLRFDLIVVVVVVDFQALKIKKHSGGGEESAAIDEIGELRISSPTLISRTTGWMSPAAPQPPRGRDDEELRISSPVLISRTTSHVRCGSNSVPSPILNDKTPAELWKNKDEDCVSGEPMREDDGDDVDVVVRVSKLESPSTPIVFTHSGLLRNPKKKKIERKLECSLEELFHGCVKKISIIRDAAISAAGYVTPRLSSSYLPIHISQTIPHRAAFEEEERVTVEVEAGRRNGTKIVVDRSDAEISLVIEEKKHPIFGRDGDDLELGVEIPLIEALTGCCVCVPLLGGGEIDVNAAEDGTVVYHGYEMIIKGEGMPVAAADDAAVPAGEERRGDLKLTFLVEFPQDLTPHQRAQIVAILEDN